MRVLIAVQAGTGGAGVAVLFLGALAEPSCSWSPAWPSLSIFFAQGSMQRVDGPAVAILRQSSHHRRIGLSAMSN